MSYLDMVPRRRGTRWLWAALLAALSSAIAFASPQADQSAPDLQPIKDYTLNQARLMQTATERLNQMAADYEALLGRHGGNYQAAWKAEPAALRNLLVAGAGSMGGCQHLLRVERGNHRRSALAGLLRHVDRRRPVGRRRPGRGDRLDPGGRGRPRPRQAGESVPSPDRARAVGDGRRVDGRPRGPRRRRADRRRGRRPSGDGHPHGGLGRDRRRRRGDGGGGDRLGSHPPGRVHGAGGDGADHERVLRAVEGIALRRRRRLHGDQLRGGQPPVRHQRHPDRAGPCLRPRLTVWSPVPMPTWTPASRRGSRSSSATSAISTRRSVPDASSRRPRRTCSAPRRRSLPRRCRRSWPAPRSCSRSGWTWHSDRSPRHGRAKATAVGRRWRRRVSRRGPPPISS